MPGVLKPAFENFRHQCLSHGKPLLEKDTVPIQASIVALLDTIPELLVQKSRRLNSKDCIVEVTATWVGMDASQREAIAVLKRAWPGSVFGEHDEKFTIAGQEESVVLSFAAKYPESRYLTGRILVTF